MTWVAVAIAGSAVLGAGSSIYAGSQQSKAAGQASNTQMQMFGQQQQALGPYMFSGEAGAARGIGTGLGIVTPGGGKDLVGYHPDSPLMRPFTLQDFQESPGYQFNLSQGLQAINKAAAARGGGNFYAPQTLQDIGRYAQGLASNEFNTERNAFMQNQANQYNRLMNFASLGQASAAGVGAGALRTGELVGNNQIGAGVAGSAGTMGASNAITGGIGNAYNAYLLNSVLSQSQGGGSIPYGGIGAVPGGMEIPPGYTAGGMPLPSIG